jgi:hypothetical protein
MCHHTVVSTEEVHKELEEAEKATAAKKAKKGNGQKGQKSNVVSESEEETSSLGDLTSSFSKPVLAVIT